MWYNNLNDCYKAIVADIKALPYNRCDRRGSFYGKNTDRRPAKLEEFLDYTNLSNIISDVDEVYYINPSNLHLIKRDTENGTNIKLLIRTIETSLASDMADIIIVKSNDKYFAFNYNDLIIPSVTHVDICTSDNYFIQYNTIEIKEHLRRFGKQIEELRIEKQKKKFDELLNDSISAIDEIINTKHTPSG